jgi:predicted DCC family thiol-disulfide oxidoreductase YuxK
VLYDGPCGFCSRWVPRWAGVLGRRGFAIDILQAPWVAEKLKLPEDELVADIRLLLTNGESLQGAAVYRYVMSRIWWAWPIYFASTLPVLSSIFEGAYRRFADNRYWISRTCHMPAKEPPPPPH